MTTTLYAPAYFLLAAVDNICQVRHQENIEDSKYNFLFSSMHNPT